MVTKRGRPKSLKPIKDKRITIRVLSSDIAKAQEVCLTECVSYIDIFRKGLEYYERCKYE